MIEIVKSQKSNLMKFFVFEADNKKPARVTKVTPDTEKDNNDYTADPDNQEAEVDTERDDQDYTGDENQTSDNEDDALGDLDRLTDDSEENDTETSDDDTEETSEDDGDGSSEDDAMNDLDNLTDDENDPDSDESEDSEDTDDGSEEDGEAEPVQQSNDQVDESFKKYSLYRDLVSLYNTVNAYINRLESILKDNIEANLVIRTVTSKLREVEDLMYDYMIIKFQSATYLQSLIFFESIVAIIGLNFKMLKNNQIYLKQ